MLKVYFYLADGPDEPLGEEEYWLSAAPRKGDTVCVVYRPPGHGADQNSIGKVVDLQWTIQKRDDQDSTAPDWCTVDIWLEPIPLNPDTDVEASP